MGTTYTVVIPALRDARLRADLSAEIEALLGRVNSAMSTYQSDSAISRFNRTTSVDWFEVPAIFAVVADQALEIATTSDGAFDPTVGPLVQRWGFGTQENSTPPSESEISQLLEQTGYQLLEVRIDPPALRKSDPQLQLDLSAIAKGFAVDEIARHVETFGFDQYLVEIGGELRVRGTNRNADPWRIGIQQPGADGAVAERALSLTSGGVATSGDYRNFIKFNNKRYSHIIDPRSGYPAEHALASVTVIADSAMNADAWATAFMVLGARQGVKVANQFNIAAYFLEPGAQGFTSVVSDDFSEIALTDQ